MVVATVSLVGGHWAPSYYSPPVRACWWWHALTCRNCDPSPVVHVGLLFENLHALGGIASTPLAKECGVVDPNEPHIFEVLADQPPAFRPLSAPPWDTATRLSVVGPLQWPHPLPHPYDHNDHNDHNALMQELDIAHVTFAAALAACLRPWTFLKSTYACTGCCGCCGLGHLCGACNVDALRCCAACGRPASAAGNCVALVMTVLAHARVGGERPPATDADILRALGLAHRAAFPRLLSLYGPVQLSKALCAAGWVPRSERRSTSHRRRDAPRGLVVCRQ